MTATSFSEGKCFLIIINIEVYGDKTTQVSITVSFVLKLTGSPVLTQLRTGPKKKRFSVPITNGDQNNSPYKVSVGILCI